MNPDDFSGNEITGYLRGYRAFCEEYAFTPDPGTAELVVFNEADGYAGTIDVAGVTIGGQFALVDFKTGRQERWHPLQGAAYLRAWVHGYGSERPVDAFMNIYLESTGRFIAKREYRGTDYADPSWQTVFLAALTCVTSGIGAFRYCRGPDEHVRGPALSVLGSRTSRLIGALTTADSLRDAGIQRS